VLILLQSRISDLFYGTMEVPGMKEDALRSEIEESPNNENLAALINGLENHAISENDEEELLGPVAPEFYDWRETFPELQLLIDHYQDILEEAGKIMKWREWPENHYGDGRNDWKVFPFVHCFPAYDASRMTWVPPTCDFCPKTVAVLKQLPSLRTALFSRLGPQTVLNTHTGWEDLANHVLRCHLCLKIPDGDTCGLEVNGKVQLHKSGQILVFDDSQVHRAWNESDEERLVLIVDLERPADIPKGRAVGGHTEELDRFINTFVATFDSDDS